jgi:hypothetical protein
MVGMIIPGFGEAEAGADALEVAGDARFVVNTGGDVLDTSRITIPQGKFGYLLDNPEKAGVFRDSMGFDQQSLGDALKQHLIDNFEGVSEQGPMEGGGVKFGVVGPMTGPSGQSWVIRSIWGVEPNGMIRFITALPD